MSCKEYLLDYVWHDWAEVPYIQGGYSYVGVEERDNDREFFSEPIEKKVYFAGEAFAKHGHIATMHGALETAIDVCDVILKDDKKNN